MVMYIDFPSKKVWIDCLIFLLQDKMSVRDIAGHNFGTKTRQFREMSRSSKMGFFLENRFCEIFTMDARNDSITFLEKVTVPSRRKNYGFVVSVWHEILSRSDVPHLSRRNDAEIQFGCVRKCHERNVLNQ